MKISTLPVLLLALVAVFPLQAGAQSIPLLPPGAAGAGVVHLQQLLNAAGEELTLPGEETGYFGAKTAESIKRIQCEYGLVCAGAAATTGYGGMGPRTRDLLVSLLAPAGSVLGASTDGLVAWYRFDENAGTAVADSAGNHSGTLAGGAWVSGKYGGALSFTGSRDRVVIPQSNDLASIPRTVAFWARLDAVKYYSIAYEDVDQQYGGINALGQLRVNWKQTDGGGSAYNLRANATAGSWQHFAVVYEPSAITIYRNGVLTATSSINGTIKGGAITSIGGRTKADGSFGGAMDEFRVYNRALSATDVKALYQAEPASAPAADTTRPYLSSISAVKSSITNTSATIFWKTDEPGTTVVEYGLTSAYGSKATGATALGLTHEVSLKNLAAGTKYYFRVVSADAAGNTATSLIRSFTTLGGASTPTTTPPVVPPIVTPVPIPAGQSTYYVDFSAGANTNPGTAAAPWKHAPGDPNATGNPAAVVLKPGDAVQFKGGVVYRGQISMKYAGTEGKPITYKGTGWGSGKAIIDGSEPVTGLRLCQSQAECGGNSNWRKIYRATVSIPAHVVEDPELHLNLMRGNDMLTLAQHPESTNRFYQARENFYTVPATRVTATSLSDSRLASLGGASLVGSFIRVWGNPNEVFTRKITGYNAGTNTVTFASFTPYPDKETQYAIANHAGDAVFDKPGEYTIDAKTGVILLWPLAAADVTQNAITMSVRPFGFSLGSYGNITIDGFLIRKQAGDSLREGHGITKFTTTSASGHTISNNEIAFTHSHQNGGTVNLLAADNTVIRDNYVHDIAGTMRGISVSGKAITIRDNHVKNVARTGIYFGATTGSTISGNLVEDNNSAHGNGISVYQASRDITVSGNRVMRSNIAFTMEQSSNITIANNLFDGSDSTSVVLADWGGMSGTNRIFNNTIVGSTNDSSLLLSSATKSPSVSYVVTNNIIDGGGTKNEKTTFANNLYTGLSWNQSTRYGWSLGATEKQADAKTVFTDPAKGDYTLRTGSPAIDAGSTLASFAADLLGRTRPSGSSFDIGAYEYRR